MRAPCTCDCLRQWAQDPDIPITRHDGEFVLGEVSSDDLRLIIRFCPFCGGIGGPDQGNRACGCGVMESLVADYPDLLEFDAEMNEFHLLDLPPSRGKLQIYYCLACGGNPSESLRPTFFEEPTTGDYERAKATMANLKNEDDFEREFGPAKYSFDLPPVSAKEIELYGNEAQHKAMDI